MKKVHIRSINRSLNRENQVLVVLKEDQGERYLPIWIPKQDGEKLVLALERKEENPLKSHTLMAKLINMGKIKVNSVCICDFDDVSAYAKMFIASRSFFGNDEELNCSLPDALNIAIRTNAPIFVLDSVMEKAGIYEGQEYLDNIEVYHGSQILGLTEIKPRKGKYNEEWVYATKDIVMAAAFLGTTGGEFTCSVGRDEDTGKPFICERFEGAFDLRYAGVKGAIYVLPGKYFVEGIHQWAVSKESVKPVHEICVTDTKEYLLKLAEEDKLTIKYYPEKPAHIPEDDEDLVVRAAIWYKHSGEEIINRLRKYHPGLLSRVMQAIEENR